MFRQGDKVRAIYFIEEGRLRLERRTFDGRLLILGTTPANEFFVEAALFSEVFHCDALASEPSRVRIYPKSAVLDALRTDPASAMSFLKLVAHQIIELRQRLELSCRGDRLAGKSFVQFRLLCNELLAEHVVPPSIHVC